MAPEPAEIRPWQQAQSIAELARLTAAWMRGELGRHPIDRTRALDPESGAITEYLLQINELGLMTTASQPGLRVDDTALVQRSFVEGYGDERLISMLDAAFTLSGFVVISFPPGRNVTCDVSVTARNGYVTSWLGRHYPQDDIANWSSSVSPEVGAIIAESWGVQIFDPVWGRNDRLWEAVTTVLRHIADAA
ncbi:hypothetical protein D9V41_09045 [Aeromicrobium phragmitis]|uniref:DUF6919 domain-containing protein n=1 Tax=Aeromicrobium phragmitis TaxID=2478914 RepID=A0A3L8PKV8_9ACTN|nr:hypothetical protein [Aeromicrobium phragmitis]RLV56025.1 hypothetical protein D9V41_09045 [Aeromicrobium phragmitis]